jgi:hypothetical protein
MTLLRLVGCALVAALCSRQSAAQGTDSLPQPSVVSRVETPSQSSVPLITVTDDSVDRWGDGQRRGQASTAGYLLRSAGTLTPASTIQGVRRLQLQVHTVYNSAIPFSMNEGGTWAGRGVAWLFTDGFDLKAGRVRVLFAPQFSLSTNRWWRVRDSVQFVPPTLPSNRNGSGYMFPWYAAPYTIDLPLRYGDVNLSRVGFGQSSISVDAKAVTFGFATENEWWGPGVRNAIVLSNNAPGFPHLFLRSSHPLDTRLGLVEFRWLAGALYESKWFDIDPTNNVRSIAAFAATVTPHRLPGLTLGLSHSVYATASSTGEGLFSFFNVFQNTGHPNDLPFGDSTLSPGGRDQVMSLFGRWVMPESGLETYVEWGRTELPKSLRDFFLYPDHTQGYTLGIQWNKPEGRSRIQGEVTTLEQSATFRDRPLGSWYTSRRVIQGYTNQGQSLGAAIGPGASSQWLAWDYLLQSWRAGLYAGRIRWNEDVRSVYNWPKYQEYCTHDVSLFVGGRGAWHTRLGFISADLNLANRINAFFEVQSSCTVRNSVNDIRNKTLSLTFAPFSR